MSTRQQHRPAGGPLSIRACAAATYALLVRDDTMNKTLPIGCHAMCAPVRARARISDFAVGQALHIRRTRADKLWSDAVLRVADVEADALKLSTHSARRKRQNVLTYPAPRGEPRIVILGRVVGIYCDL